MKIIVGLGNPGSEYVGTRHNVGWEVIDRLAMKIGLVTKPSEFDRLARSKFDGLIVDGRLGEERLVLLKPMTFMNLSGQSVQAASGFYQLSPSDVLIVLDDIALPCGKIRVRANGSSGGHNGLKDIERALGTSEYPRLRIGIDPPPPRVPQRDYVLGKFSSEQRTKIHPAIDRAIGAIITWIEKGTTTAMNRFNADEESTKN